MIRRIIMCLLLACSLLLIGCDYCVKECTYEVYQHGEELDADYVVYKKCYEHCVDFEKNGVFYKIKKIKKVDWKDIKY